VKECQLLKRKQRFGALMTSTKGYLPFLPGEHNEVVVI